MAVIAAVVVASGSAATGLILMWGGGSTSAAGRPLDMNGKPVVLDPGDTLTPSQRARQDAASGGYGRLRVPSIGLDVPLGALNEVDEQITPPGFTSAYWVRNLGTAPTRAAAGTVFVVTHAAGWGARAPGNYLVDADRGTATIGAGTRVVVDGVSYTVTGSRAIAKQQLGQESDVWLDSPNRLVIITCLQRYGGSPAVDNLVITAVRTR